MVTFDGGAMCWVRDCYRPGDVADHIRPVYPGMPDSEFYDWSNLRPSCRRHNLFKGHAEALARETSGVVTSDYSRARLQAGPTIFSRRRKVF
jgi:hypothetical protein